MISQRSIDLIVGFEVSDQAKYTKQYQKPTWPGGASGVTIGIGYDCGYVSVDELHNDWQGRIPDKVITVLDEHAVGTRGEAADSIVHWMRQDNTVVVSWDAAIAEFTDVEVPKWIARTSAALPNTDMLSDDSFGALVSLAYNRGASFAAQDARHLEMRNIKGFMQSKQFARIPYEIRSMKRLWPTIKGLRDRREKEAVLFEEGLTT